MNRFAEFSARVRAEVDDRLASWLGDRVAEAHRHGPDVAATVDAVRALVLRGGKRFRAVLVAAGYEGCKGEGGGARVVMAGVAMELLQAYLLIHDDWMDGDLVRRGGPSVHAMFRERYGSERIGDASAILAGDLACGLAQQALLAVPVSAERLLGAARELARVQTDVVCGQVLDVRAEGAIGLERSEDVERTHTLKTGSYTVRGPLVIGATLAGALQEDVAALERFAAPLGVAFQLKDDLLGVFGDPSATGKAALGDLAQGKHTALVAEVSRDPEARALLARAAAADAPAQRALVERMVASGAKRRVEDRLVSLLEQARSALAALPVTAEMKGVLADAVTAIGERER